MKDPTSDLGEDISPDEAPACEWCGDSLANAPNRRTRTWVEDGEVQRLQFCDDACLRSLRDSQE